MAIRATSKPVGEAVSEMSIDYGPGYRLYFTQRGELTWSSCSAGGDKRTQDTRHRLRNPPGPRMEGVRSMALETTPWDAGG